MWMCAVWYGCGCGVDGCGWRCGDVDMWMWMCYDVFMMCCVFHFSKENFLFLFLDIKPQNILLTDVNTLQVKLVDFGVSKVLEETFKMSTRIGSPSTLFLFCSLPFPLSFSYTLFLSLSLRFSLFLLHSIFCWNKNKNIFVL